MKSRSLGFTLIELLIVIAVLGALAAVLITVLNPLQQFKKARDAQRRNDLKTIQKALEVYYQDHGAYPQSVGNWDNSISGGEWIVGLDSKYIDKLPVDPLNKGCTSEQISSDPGCYAYSYYSNPGWGCNIAGRDYVLIARLESTQDNQGKGSFYYPNGTFCSDWGPAAGIVVLQAP